MMYTWNIIKEKLSNDEQDFFREKQMQDKYEVHKLNLLEQGISLEQHIKNTCLKDMAYSFCFNKFPYDLDKNIAHYVLWFDPKFIYTSDMVENLIRFHLDQKHYQGYEFVYYMNEVEIQSISGIPHFQVFCKT